MKISNIKYEIIEEENDYKAKDRAEKMLEMANELRAERDKAQQVYGSATQEIGWKKVQVFLENIETQIRPLLYALKEIKEAEGLTGRFGINIYMRNEVFTRWELYADDNGKIEILAQPSNSTYSSNFPGDWVKENGEPRGSYSAEVFYGKDGLIANTDFPEVLKAIDKEIEEKYNEQLDKLRDKQTYYENSFKKMANIDKDVSLDAVIKNAEKKIAESFDKEIHSEKDIEKD